MYITLLLLQSLLFTAHLPIPLSLYLLPTPSTPILPIPLRFCTFLFTIRHPHPTPLPLLLPLLPLPQPLSQVRSRDGLEPPWLLGALDGHIWWRGEEQTQKRRGGNGRKRGAKMGKGGWGEGRGGNEGYIKTQEGKTIIKKVKVLRRYEEWAKQLLQYFFILHYSLQSIF